MPKKPMSKRKTPVEELQQITIALNILADQWQNVAPIQSKALRALLPKIEALPSGASQNDILASVLEASTEALKKT